MVVDSADDEASNELFTDKSPRTEGSDVVYDVCIPPLALYQRQKKTKTKSNKNKDNQHRSSNKFEKAAKEKSPKASRNYESCDNLGTVQANNYSIPSDENSGETNTKKLSLPYLPNTGKNMGVYGERRVSPNVPLHVSTRGCSSLPPLSNDREMQRDENDNTSDDNFSQSMNAKSAFYSCEKLPVIRRKSHSFPDLLQYSHQQHNDRSKIRNESDSSDDNSDRRPRAGKTSNKLVLPKLG